MKKEMIIYLDRDNEARLVLRINGKTVEEGIVTKVSVDLAESSFVAETPIEISTETSYMTLTNNGTEVILNMFGAPLKAGKHVARVTVYDVSSTNGIAWDYVVFDVRNWDI